MKKNTQSVKLIETVIAKQPVEFQSIFEDLINDKIAKLVESVKEDLHKKIFEESPADITGDEAETDGEDESEENSAGNAAMSESVILEGWDGMSHQAKELVLHADNNSQLDYTSKQPVMKNLMQKYKKGVYKPDLARKLWGYHADRAALSYVKENGPKDTPWHKAFPQNVRKEAASHWEAMHHDDMKAG